MQHYRVLLVNQQRGITTLRASFHYLFQRENLRRTTNYFITTYNKNLLSV